MKKTLVALAVMAAAGAASAQSSVTLFGIVDVGLQYGSGDLTDKLAMTRGAYNTNRIGFRGTEDLGGGLQAGFWLEAGFNPDEGSGATAGSANNLTTVADGNALMFGRRATVSLSGGFGEVRLGRDIVSYFYGPSTFDPFGGVGVGVSQGYLGGYTAGWAGSGVVTNVRASNMIQYFLPRNLGGIYGQASYFLGESMQSGLATEDDGSGYGLRLGYAAGPINVAAAFGSSEISTGDVSTWNVGGTWDFGVAKAFANYVTVENDTAALETKGFLIGASAALGAGEVRASYSQSEADVAGTSPEAKKLALGYVHNLSKRTAVYTTVAYVRNSGGANFALGGATVSANDNSTGFDLGIRHAF